MTPQEECDLRNAYISLESNEKLPSYSLWRIHDIQFKSIEDRIRWWSQVESTTPEQIDMVQSVLMKLFHAKFLLDIESQSSHTLCDN